MKLEPKVKLEPKETTKVKLEPTKVKKEPGVCVGIKRFRMSKDGDDDVLEETKPRPITMEISDDGIIYYLIVLFTISDIYYF